MSSSALREDMIALFTGCCHRAHITPSYVRLAHVLSLEDTVLLGDALKVTIFASW